MYRRQVWKQGIQQRRKTRETPFHWQVVSLLLGVDCGILLLADVISLLYLVLVNACFFVEYLSSPKGCQLEPGELASSEFGREPGGAFGWWWR